MNKAQQSPLFHISKRGALPWYKAWGIRGGAVLVALIVCGIILAGHGRKPVSCLCRHL